ncbi:hypothetical protein AaE_004522 [Aphanomyces astaci]|uniref:Uncharacterized protein n=1 Tax=Aphanomyces astaci TaxID=112090 RepID=A0A6A5A4K5_APHAT|nr:hypothetical protein AaE_004522 [Aphanomyces astaci]
MDESYIHHNYARHNDSLYFPDDNRQRTKTTMEDVWRRLDIALGGVPSDVIYRCISHTKKKVSELSAYLVELEAADEAVNEPALPGEDESSDDAESDDDQSILTDIVV